MGLQRGIVGAEKELVREWFGNASNKQRKKIGKKKISITTYIKTG